MAEQLLYTDVDEIHLDLVVKLLREEP